MGWRCLGSAGLVLVALLASGCGGSSGSQATPASRVVHVPGSATGKIVLSSDGARHIGIQTVAARGAAGTPAQVVVPFSAIVYDPSGKTYAFVRSGRLTYVEVPVRVDHVAGSAAYLAKGPPAGARVVSVGAEELFGVQTGVLAQS